jgi:hypothetical protein
MTIRSTVIVKFAILASVLSLFGYLSVLLLHFGVWPFAILAGCLLMSALSGVIVFDLIDTWRHALTGGSYGAR